MFGFILRRAALIIPTFVGVTLLAFAKSGGNNQALFNGIQVNKLDRRITVKLDGPPELLGMLLK